MKEQIIDCISKGGVSFVELTREVPGFEGEYQIRSSQNWIYWSGLSKEACDILQELENDDIIIKQPTSPIIYVIDGGWVKYPVVKQNRTYKHPHWLPVTYSLTKKGIAYREQCNTQTTD